MDEQDEYNIHPSGHHLHDEKLRKKLEDFVLRCISIMSCKYFYIAWIKETLPYEMEGGCLCLFIVEAYLSYLSVFGKDISLPLLHVGFTV